MGEDWVDVWVRGEWVRVKGEVEEGDWSLEDAE